MKDYIALFKTCKDKAEAMSLYNYERGLIIKELKEDKELRDKSLVVLNQARSQAFEDFHNKVSQEPNINKKVLYKEYPINFVRKPNIAPMPLEVKKLKTGIEITAEGVLII